MTYELMTRIAGWPAKKTTALEYKDSPPEDLEDAYVMKDGRLREVWDVGIKTTDDGKIILYGNWPDSFDVEPNTPIFYSPPERWK